MPRHRTDEYWTQRQRLRRAIESCVEKHLIQECLPDDVDALHEELIAGTLEVDITESVSDGFKSALSVTSLC